MGFFQVNMVTNVKDWVVDSKAMKHICGNKSAFTFHTTIEDDEEHRFKGDLGPFLVIMKGK